MSCTQDVLSHRKRRARIAMIKLFVAIKEVKHCATVFVSRLCDCGINVFEKTEPDNYKLSVP